jgi:hypothetical protein
MIHSRSRATVVRIYNQVNLALWAALAAFLLFCAFVIVPQMPRTQAEAKAARVAAREREDAFYCKRWGFAEDTAAYAGCMSDLIALRRSVEQQLADESLP